MLQRGSVPEARSVFQLAIRLCNQSDDISAERVAHQLRLAHGNQARAAGESHDYTGCLHHANIWLDLSEKRLSPSGNSITDFELDTAYSELGVAHVLHNNLTTARRTFLKASLIHESVEELEATMSAEPRLNLGLIRWIQGWLSEAEVILTEVLEIQEDAFGVDDTQSLL